MGRKTEIAWTDTTFNPWWGCTKVSPACDHCYAERLARRFGVQWGVGKSRRYFGDKHWEEPRRWNAQCMKRGKTMRVFCASMADVFDNEVEQHHREQLWRLIRETTSLTWLMLTKRIGNAAKMLPANWGTGYSNVQLGITVVNQDEVDRDVPKLLATAARVRFLSVEPLLEPVNLKSYLLRPCIQCDGTASVPAPSGGKACPRCFDVGQFVDPDQISWVIVGGESGTQARSMPLNWARSIKEQCRAASIPFFMKQLSQVDSRTFRDVMTFPVDLQVQEVVHSAN